MTVDLFEKPFVFITGAPRSGTSVLIKIIDAHPDIAILMENTFGNRRRHWKRVDYWNSSTHLKKEVGKIYSKFNESVIGNKVCTPDVWFVEDIHFFCKLFKNRKN